MSLTYTAKPSMRRLHDLDPNTWIVILFVAIAISRGILYALLTPPFSAPDEKGHYDYLASLHENGWGRIEGRESHQPPLYYLLSLPLFAAFAGQVSDLAIYALAADNVSLSSLLAVRCFSVLLTAATVPLAYLAARLLCPEDRFVSLGTAAFVALVPAYGWVGASINNDSLANLFSSVLILMMLRGIRDGFTVKGALVMAALAVAGVASKPTTLPSAALLPVVIGLSLAFQRWSARRVAAIALLLAALSALFFASPARILVTGPLGAVMKRPITLDFLAADRIRIFVATLDVWPFVYQFKTFWGSFSNDSIQLPSPVYYLLAAMTAMSLAGLLYRAIRSRARAVNSASRGESQTVRAAQVTLMLGIVALEWLISMSRFYNNQSLQLSRIVAGWNENFTLLQGRFLYPAIVPIAFLFARGLRALLPTRWAGQATWVLVAVLIAVDWVAIGTLGLAGHSWQAYLGQG